MSFDTQSFLTYKNDVRFDIFTQEIHVDKDLKANEITWLNPGTGKVNFGGADNGTCSIGTSAKGLTATSFTPVVTGTIGSGSFYNSAGDLHFWDVYLSSDYKSAMYSSGIEMGWHTEQVRGPLSISVDGTSGVLSITQGTLQVGCGCVPGKAVLGVRDELTVSENYEITTTGTPTSGTVTLERGVGIYGGSSIPWNTIGAFFQTYSLLENQQQAVCEQYINVGTLPSVSTSKLLLKYKHDALESNDMLFNTPCIESNFDNSTSLSKESALRAEWFAQGNGRDPIVSGTNDTSAKRRKNIILFSDMFESMETEGILQNSTRYRLQFTMQTPDKIAMNTTARIFTDSAIASITTTATAYYVGKLYVFVDDMRIISDCARMQPAQAIESSSEQQAGRVENLGWCQNYGVSTPYSSGTQVVLTAQRDVQSVILGCPTLGNKVSSLGAVGINPTQAYHGLFTQLQPAYGNDFPFKTPIKMSQSSVYNVNENTSAYYMMRKQCNSEKAYELPISLTFKQYKTYHYYYMPIYSPLSIHRNNDPKDIRVDTSCGTNTNFSIPTVVNIIARKFQGAQLLADGSVVIMSQ